MSYQKNTWVDHIVDPGTGEVVQQGTKFTATRANNIEAGIEKAHQLVEGLAQNILGSSVISGLAFTTNGLTANYTAGSAYVNGVKFDVAAGSMSLNATQGQYIYLDSDGTIKKTTSQATADAKCSLWYFATDASSVITTSDKRSLVIGTTSAITIDPAQVPTGNTGKLLQILSWFANRIKAITGKANWWDAPVKTLEQLNTDKYDKAGGEVTGDITIRKGVAKLIFDTTRAATSLIQWNASASADFGMDFKVDGVTVLQLKSDKTGTLGGKAILTEENYAQKTLLSQYASSPDANGKFTVVDFKRPDGTLYLKSTLSNPDANGNYQTNTWQFYDAAGTTIVLTKTWTISYNADGLITSKVVA
ncbi:hypothetical protein D478_26379 [Brevibacillus agri BAB-2500]|nr:hypothetical protein D478_26379 [Brevibacillus agri BAB-2500]